MDVTGIEASDIQRYHDHVLQRPNDDLDAQCSEEAVRLRLTWCLPPIDVDGQSRCSESTRASDSTDLTSIFSDRQSLRSAGSTHIHTVRNSFSSFLSQSTASSVSSIYDQTRDAAKKKKSFSRIRELSVLRFYKTSSRINLSNGCSHCPQDVVSQRRAVHELPCGHRWCLQALRARLTRWDLQSTEFCCGQAIPDRLVQLVLRPDECVIYSARAELSKYRMAGGEIMAVSQYLQVREQQHRMKDRFEEWAQDLLARLDKQHTDMRHILDSKHQLVVDELLGKHAEALSTAEDKQVKAEADLLDLQAREEQDHTTALMYMEAFCSGVLRSGEQHHRHVTEQDVVELQKTQAQRANLAQKHNNAINILRGEQQRRIKLRVQRQDQEVQNVEAVHRREELSLEQEFRRAGEIFEADFAQRRRQLEARWDAEMAVCLRLIREGVLSSNMAREVDPTSASMSEVDLASASPSE